jgi:hypothetical protein
MLNISPPKEPYYVELQSPNSTCSTWKFNHMLQDDQIKNKQENIGAQNMPNPVTVAGESEDINMNCEPLVQITGDNATSTSWPQSCAPPLDASSPPSDQDISAMPCTPDSTASAIGSVVGSQIVPGMSPDSNSPPGNMSPLDAKSGISSNASSPLDTETLPQYIENLNMNISEGKSCDDQTNGYWQEINRVDHLLG